MQNISYHAMASATSRPIFIRVKAEKAFWWIFFSASPLSRYSVTIINPSSMQTPINCKMLGWGICLIKRNKVNFRSVNQVEVPVIKLLTTRCELHSQIYWWVHPGFVQHRALGLWLQHLFLCTSQHTLPQNVLLQFCVREWYPLVECRYDSLVSNVLSIIVQYDYLNRRANLFTHIIVYAFSSGEIDLFFWVKTNWGV